MVHALAVHHPFTNGEGLVLYHPSPVENYFAVAPESRWLLNLATLR
jgi:hypothetical protein